MGANSSKKKSETLGMPHGTAANKLRKRIMFSLLVRLNENFCFKCGAEIESDNELSVEHKEPWEGISADLFWDLDNIAFSHLSCNRPHRPNGGGQHKRIVGEPGTSWCTTCKQFLPIESFAKNRSSWKGISYDCKACQKIYKDRVRGKSVDAGVV